MTTSKNNNESFLLNLLKKSLDSQKDKFQNFRFDDIHEIKIVPLDSCDPNTIYFVNKPIQIGSIPIRTNLKIEIERKCQECGSKYVGEHPNNDCSLGSVQNILDV